MAKHQLGHAWSGPARAEAVPGRGRPTTVLQSEAKLLVGGYYVLSTCLHTRQFGAVLGTPVALDYLDRRVREHIQRRGGLVSAGLHPAYLHPIFPV